MMKKWIGPSLAAALIAAVLLPGCGGPSIPVAAPTSTANLVFGCNWSFESTSQNANFAYPDTNAVYWVAAVPDSIPSGDKIEISGASATARYFSYEIYTEDGVSEADLSDAQIFGQGTTPADAVTSGQSYTVSIVYSTLETSSGTTLVANPSVVSPRAPAHKYLFYRLYLPTSGADEFSNLPTLTYVAANGTRTPLSATPDQPSCNYILQNIQNTISGVSTTSSSSSSSGGSSSSSSGSTTAVSPPAMKVFTSSTGIFQNLDVTYMFEETSTSLGDMLIVRGKAPAFATGSQSPQVRYWSVCSDRFDKPTSVVACVADQDATIGSDGYYNVIISPQTPPSGYQTLFNYLSAGADAFGTPIYRQLLANPLFLQSAKNNKDSLDVSLTMGAYYPETTYCSNSVFSANLSAGAAAVFSACQSSEGSGSVTDTGN